MAFVLQNRKLTTSEHTEIVSPRLKEIYSLLLLISSACLPCLGPVLQNLNILLVAKTLHMLEVQERVSFSWLSHAICGVQHGAKKNS